MKTRTITGVALFTALVAVLQVISNYIQFGTVSINLAIIPIVIGSVIFGPLCGLFLGIVDGALILTAPSTMFFLSYNAWATVLLCLTKTGIAGLMSGFIPKLIKNDKVAIVVSSLIIPIINTGIFILGCYIFFMPLFKDSGLNVFTIGDIMVVLVGINFFIEFGVLAVLSPTIYYIYEIIKKKYLLARQKNS